MFRCSSLFHVRIYLQGDCMIKLCCSAHSKLLCTSSALALHLLCTCSALLKEGHQFLKGCFKYLHSIALTGLWRKEQLNIVWIAFLSDLMK